MDKNRRVVVDAVTPRSYHGVGFAVVAIPSPPGAPHLRAAGAELAEAVRQSTAGDTDIAHATLERALRRVHAAVFGTPDWRFVEIAVERAAKGRLGPRKRNTH